MQLTVDEADDILYLARVNDLEELNNFLAELAQKYSIIQKKVLEAAIEEDSGNCVLHFAAGNGHTDLLKHLLLTLGAPSSALTNVSKTPSPSASTSQPQQPASQPTSANSSTTTLVPPPSPLINHPNTSHNTPLHWAALNGHLLCAQLLVAAGADIVAKNQLGRVPLQEADQAEKWDVVGWLAERGGLPREMLEDDGEEGEEGEGSGADGTIEGGGVMEVDGGNETDRKGKGKGKETVVDGIDAVREGLEKSKIDKK